MPFTKNDKNINYEGRPKGALNKNTITFREKVEKLNNENLDALLLQISNLSLKERLQLNRDLLPFLIPKYATIVKDETTANTNAIKTIYIADGATN